MQRFTTITDLATHLADAMDLDREQVIDAIGNNHHLFGNYGDPMPATELAALSAAVWTSVTGRDYPDDWARHDAARIADELEAAV